MRSGRLGPDRLIAAVLLSLAAAFQAAAADPPSLALTVPPAACFAGGTPASVTGVIGAALTFTATPADATSVTATTRYFWDFGDGTPIQGGVAKQVQHPYATAGRYTLRLRVANGTKTQEIPADVLIQGSCEQYRDAKGAWSAACNPQTAPGFYWQVGPEIEEYGWWGVVSSGVAPPCNEATVGQSAMTYAWYAQPTWAPVQTAWCRNHQDNSNQGCTKGQGTVYSCPQDHCGIYKATCQRQAS